MGSDNKIFIFPVNIFFECILGSFEVRLGFLDVFFVNDAVSSQ